MRMEDVLKQMAGATPITAASLGQSAGHQSKTNTPPPSALLQGERTVSLG